MTAGASTTLPPGGTGHRVRSVLDARNEKRGAVHRGLVEGGSMNTRLGWLSELAIVGLLVSACGPSAHTPIGSFTPYGLDGDLKE